MKDTKISQNKQKKGKIIAEVSVKVSNAKALVFTNYKGLTHQQIENFKKNIAKCNAEYVVTKNRLLHRALTEHNYKVDIATLEQPTATLFLYEDPIEPLKLLAKMIKELKMPAIKFGIMEGQIIDEAQVITLSKLPPKEILLAQLVGMLQSPIAGLHHSLQWNIQKFVMTVKAIEEKKQTI